MKELVKELDKYQKELATLEEDIKDRTEDFAKSIEDLTTKRQSLVKLIEDQKIKINEIVLQKFKETKEKKYDGGIGVQEREKISYDEVEVLKWAQEKKLFLTLDKKAFEKVATSIGAPTVKSEKVAQTTYPKELKLED